MTRRYWNHLKQWDKGRKKGLNGWICLYPESFQFVENPSFTEEENFKKDQDIYVFPISIRIGDKHLSCIARKVDFGATMRVNVPFNHIKKIKLEGFNLDLCDI